ncbi:hypothetical protein [Paremcibacter congregatus]|uniref:hypothetical protein n=1 Tax=Paremcibacter congregatus TaxID=2043170 RepID=UPI0030EDCB12|tara:strand:- start:393 stop:629 length:237 start_codon:yes stop_codon:yes gene_type:complete
MTQKIYNASIKTGEYVHPETGEVKGRYENVGSVMKGDDGSFFLILRRTFNPAGLPNPDNKDNIIVGLYEPKKKEFGNE